jgi:hypothetical protein
VSGVSGGKSTRDKATAKDFLNLGRFLTEHKQTIKEIVAPVSAPAPIQAVATVKVGTLIPDHP